MFYWIGHFFDPVDPWEHEIVCISKAGVFPLDDGASCQSELDDPGSYFGIKDEVVVFIDLDFHL